MGQSQMAIGSLARTRVRNALLDLTWNGARVISLGEIANHSRLARDVTRACMIELEDDGQPFEVTRVEQEGELEWRVA